MVIQYLFVVLFWLPGYLYFSHYHLSGLGYSVGYNYPIHKEENADSPPQISRLGFSQQYFISNFNFSFILYFVPAVGLAIYVYLYKKIKHED